MKRALLLWGIVTILLAWAMGCVGEATPVEVGVTPTASPTTPPPTPSPRPPTPTPLPSPSPTPIQAMSPVTITDNNPYDPRLKRAWGFSCLVETGTLSLLFDTGGDAPTLLGNMEALGIDVSRIQAVVLSHIHGDHVGGLAGILALNREVTVYVPRSFPASFKRQVRVFAPLVEVSGPSELFPGVYTTGEMGARLVEQSLVLKTGQGLVVITGCAHPGIQHIVDKAHQLWGDVYLVVGGFHLGGRRKAEIEDIVAAFRRLGVRKVAPCHCSGDQARKAFREEYGDDYIPAGVGTVIVIGGER